MIPAEQEAEILRLFKVEAWPVGTIAREIGVHHGVVRRVLRDTNQIPASTKRPSKVDPYVPYMVETLEKYPTLHASRLFEMVRARGYTGQPDHFRSVVAKYRPRKPAEAYLRLRTLPAEQGQVDWAHFGRIAIGRAQRPLMAFVLVLSWSRHVFLRFSLDQRMGSFLDGHVRAFAFFSGLPRVLLYDNLKSAVLERRGDAIRFNPTLLAFASHYTFEPRPVAIRRGNEKGRVERAIQYVRTSFFPARSWTDLDDLNAQALDWCRGLAAQRRCPEDRSLSVGEAFASEQPRLLGLPADAFPTDDLVTVRAGKTPYVRFDSNDYSVPHDRVRRALVVRASTDTVRVLDDNEVIATHARSWDRDQQIEDAAHLIALIAMKREAREARGKDRLQISAPRTRDLLVALAQRGQNLGAATNGLLRLLDAYGAAALDRAVGEAMDAETPHLAAVHHVLDREQWSRGRPPPVPVALPEDSRVRGVVVRPHALAAYDPPAAEVVDDE